MPYDIPTTAAAAPMPELPAQAAESVTPDDPVVTSSPTANEGSHPLAVSPQEGLFAVPQDAMIAALQKLLRIKYGAVILWMNYGDRVRAHFRDSIYDHFQEHMKEEISFCYDLAMKITALGGEPTPKVAPVPDMLNMHHMFMNIIENEKEQIQVERDILAKVGENTGLKVLIENMVLTDQRHADDARRMMLCEQG
jgi:bacterioferritin (cytochrome b1)